jgi:hypothetical protein
VFGFPTNNTFGMVGRSVSLVGSLLAIDTEC